jgi:hypothetical protein
MDWPQNTIQIASEDLDILEYTQGGSSTVLLKLESQVSKPYLSVHGPRISRPLNSMEQRVLIYVLSILGTGRTETQGQ